MRSWGFGPRSTPRALRHPGFTVIELLLVILILGTLAGLSAPKLRGSYERLRVTESANSLRSAIRMARELSITESVPYRVAIDISEGTYWIEKWMEGEGRYERAQSKWGGTHRLSDGIEMSSAPESVGFGPDGRAEYPDLGRGLGAIAPGPVVGRPESEETRIVLTNELGQSRAVVLDIITGRVWVEVQGT